MFITGDIRSLRAEGITRTITLPPGISYGLILLDELSIDESNLNSNFVYLNDPSLGYYGIFGRAEDISGIPTELGEDSPARKVLKGLLDLGIQPYFILLQAFKDSSSRFDWDGKIKSAFESALATNDFNEFLKRDITFIFASLPSYKDVPQVVNYYMTIANHVASASKKDPSFDEEGKPKYGQLERYFICGEFPEVNYISSIVGSITNKDAYRRTMLFTGNFTEVSLPFISGGKYILSDVEKSYDLTWSLVGIPAINRYVGYGDFAKPLTQKIISGVNFYGLKLGTLKTSDLYKEGAALLLADEPNTGVALCYRSNLISYGKLRKGELLSYPEDIELTIMFLEDLMDKENRNFLRQFRGWMATKKNLLFIQSQFIDVVLSGYVNRGWIEKFTGVKIWMDQNDPTIIRGYYKYRPIYPINKIWVEHFFIV